MKSLIRYLVNGLPLVAIALVIAFVIYPKFVAPSAKLDGEERSNKIVNAPERRELPQSEEYQVINIHDGDTLTVQGNWGKQKIRLCGIDAPELDQPLGYESRDFARSLVASAGNNIILMPIEKDRYGRTVAEVFVALKDGQEKSLQEELLKSGLANSY
ncbi:thermonuclease family protein [Gloeocapsopsis crepidinum LEGE 06123]|uniref:Thermonuclease family protein n=1 Tax=Gloeocapsopsis crepidinum LEGE 06123 TaxID=588587 RepID=A0ABR9UZ54_9CHRO|nr:thermonuclease family protein [Gloeocapsopsis crepidinum]MBE9193593.1 thermonuclease family protein [Gloeocapsopsis crepidinum LEGE 06123]